MPKRTRGQADASKRPTKRKVGVKFKSGKKTMPRASSSKILALANAVEHKYFDTSLTNSAVVIDANMTGLQKDPATLLTLFCPQAGDDAESRDGRAAMVDEIHVKGEINFQGSEGGVYPSTGGAVFLALVQDTQTNAAQCASQDVYTNKTASVMASHLPLRNPNGWTRFNTLKTEMITKKNDAITQAGANDFSWNEQIYPFEWYVKFPKPIMVRFNNVNGGTVADIVDNSWHIIASLRGATGAGPTPSAAISYNCRVRYYG